MMIERHYDDETLISLMEANRTRADKHIPGCTVCADKLDSFRTISGTLREEDVWDTRPAEPVPSTIANLRAFANRMTSEDAHAEQFLPQLLAGSRESWMPRLREHPEWRTAGMVRKVMAAANHALDTMPPDAVEMTALATDIADHLDPSAHTSDTVARLRGAAWRDRGYALYYTGHFSEAGAAVERAEAAFGQCVVDEYDRARVGIVRALVMRAFDKFADGRAAASASGKRFEAFGDVNRMVSAGLAEANILTVSNDFQAAVRVLERLEVQVRDCGNADTHARVLANLGYVTWKLGRLAAAVAYYDAATAIFEDLGTRTEAVRNRWVVASVLAETGQTAEAQKRLRSVVADLNELGMTSDHAVASLDLAELLLAETRFDEVDALCRAAIRSFEVARVAYTERAVTALGYLREASVQRQASLQLLRHVREYVRRLPDEPKLLFAELPA
jgi:tetratricopeptide (TPR) repeat protein